MDNCKLKPVQALLDFTTHERWSAWCKSRNVKSSESIRRFIHKTIYNAQTFPGYRTEAFEEIDASIEDMYTPEGLPKSILIRTPEGKVYKKVLDRKDFW